MNKVSLLAVIVAMAVPMTATATKAVNVEGVAAIVKDDVAMARDRAIDDAKRKAVEQVAGSQVSSESITKNFQLVEDRIYARASGFVKRYKIVSEHQDQGVYKVQIEAEVDARRVADDLSLIMKTRPRVILMIAEQNVGKNGFSYWWGAKGFVADMDILRNALIQAWRPRGFKFVDPSLLGDALTVKGALQTPELSNKAAATIARDADADIAIVGKVLVTDQGPVMKGVDMRTFNAVGSLRVLNVDTAEIIAVADHTGTSAHLDPNVGGRAAIKNLGQRLEEDLERQILTQWTEQAASARNLELVVKGVRSSKVARAVERVIREEIRGVESVRMRRRRKGKAYYAVRVRANATDFGRDLEAKTYPQFALETVNISRAKLVAQVKQ